MDVEEEEKMNEEENETLFVECVEKRCVFCCQNLQHGDATLLRIFITTTTIVKYEKYMNNNNKRPKVSAKKFPSTTNFSIIRQFSLTHSSITLHSSILIHHSSFIHPSIHTPTHLSIHLSIYPPIHLSTYSATLMMDGSAVLAA